jgi:hypothetical protein
MANEFGNKMLEGSAAGFQTAANVGGRAGDNPLENYLGGEAARMRREGYGNWAGPTEWTGWGGMRAGELALPVGSAVKGLVRGAQGLRALRAAGAAGQGVAAATAAPAATATGAGAAANPFPASMAAAARSAAPAAAAAATTAAKSTGWLKPTLQWGVLPTAGAIGFERLFGDSRSAPEPTSLGSVMSHPGTWIGLLGLLSLLNGGGGGGLGGLLPLLLLGGGGGLLAGHAGMLDEGERLAEPNLGNIKQYLTAAQAGDPGAQYALARVYGKQNYGQLGEMAAPGIARLWRTMDPKGFTAQFAGQ